MDNTNELHVDTGRKGKYFVVRVRDEDPGNRGDLTGLIDIIRDCLENDIKTIAVSFTKSTRLYTRQIATLIRCYALVDDKGGSFAIIAPNPDLMHALDLAGIDTIINTFQAEEELPE